MKARSLRNLSVPSLSVARTTDPVELHILSELAQLRSQNLRLKSYVQKSGVWAEMKAIDTWKPFDFLHYFCVLFQRKYRKEYKVNGNIVHNYQRIETFMKVNNINNECYRKFIELAFSRHFTNNLIPNLGHIVSHILYNKLMGDSTRETKTQDWFDLDQQISQENEQFENALRCPDNYDVLDKRLLEENAYIQSVMRPNALA